MNRRQIRKAQTNLDHYFKLVNFRLRMKLVSESLQKEELKERQKRFQWWRICFRWFLRLFSGGGTV